MATIPIWDPTNNKKIFVEHPTMLPHEVIHYLVATGCVTVQEVADLSGRHDQNLGSKKKAFCDKHLLDDKVCVALGFHGDGVPFQKSTHKQASTEVLSWNFLCDKDGKRYMFCNINQDFVCCCGCHGRCTLDALLEVFVWSMDIMLEEHVPLDEERNPLRSNPLGFSGVLLQLLSFTNWNSNSICWRCKATKESYKDCGPTTRTLWAHYNEAKQYWESYFRGHMSLRDLFAKYGNKVVLVVPDRQEAMPRILAKVQRDLFELYMEEDKAMS